MKRVCVVTGCRSEWGLLEPFVERLCYIEGLAVNVVSVGPNSSIEHCIEVDVPDYMLTTIPTMLSSNTKEGITKSIGITVMSVAQYFASNSYDLVILLGDRWESLAVAIAAHTFRIPIMHLHAGEETVGSTDNAHRHSISHMATYLGVPTWDALGKLVTMLPEKHRRIVGGLGMHKIDEVVANEEFDVVISMHPETIGGTGMRAYQIWDAVQRVKRSLRFFTTTESPDVDFCVSFEAGHLKRSEYLSILKGAKVIIGNSSSGIIEAPALGTPTINVGSRQDGRPMGRSIFQADTVQFIRTHVDTLLSPNIKTNYDNYYGTDPIPKTVNWIKEILS